MKFRDRMIEAMKEHARGHIAKHKMNVEIYLNNAVGVGGKDTADILEEIEKEFFFTSKVLERIKNKKILYFSTLFHDIGKGYLGNHNVVGSKITQDICGKFDLSEIMLAGGIGAEDINFLQGLNVWGIDINSKFEIKTGIKNHKLLESLRNYNE